MKIHATAIVHPDAELAADVTVEPYTIIGPQVRIGAGTVVGPHCVLDGRTVIGENNRIFGSAQIGVLSQDLKHKEHLVGRCEIGDGNMIREHTVISASTMANEADNHVTSIGNKCLIMSNVHIGHDCHLGSGCVLATGTGLSGHVTIHDKAIIGGIAGVHQDVVIGTLSFTGGMSRTVKDVPPYMLAEGIPCKVYGPNTVGLKRNGLDEAARRRVKEMHRMLYRSNLNVSQGVQEIERSVDESPEKATLLDFIRNSKRGITF